MIDDKGMSTARCENCSLEYEIDPNFRKMVWAHCPHCGREVFYTTGKMKPDAADLLAAKMKKDSLRDTLIIWYIGLQFAVWAVLLFFLIKGFPVR